MFFPLELKHEHACWKPLWAYMFIKYKYAFHSDLNALFRLISVDSSSH